MRILYTPRGRAARLCSSAILLLSMLTVSVAEGAVIAQEPGPRMMPPSGLKCDRNDLTVYDGKVLAYRRRKGATFLRIRTNFDTTEAVTIRHPGTDDPSVFYLLNSEPFTRSDWRRIEKGKKLLKPGIRANVWVCRGNPAIQPVVDWRPDDTGANTSRVTFPRPIPVLALSCVAMITSSNCLTTARAGVCLS